MPIKSKRMLTAALVTAGIASACSIDSVTGMVHPYRIDVRQGNYVDQSMIAQLRRGMTRDQVRFVMGSPLVSDIFHDDRWDYVYRFQPGKGAVQQRIISVFFVDEYLDHVAGDVTEAADYQEVLPDAEGSGKPRVIEISPISEK